MESINGILIVTPEERASIEAAIGPLVSCRVDDVRLQLINAVERREAKGYFLWAEFIRCMLEQVAALANSSDFPKNG